MEHNKMEEGCETGKSARQRQQTRNVSHWGSKIALASFFNFSNGVFANPLILFWNFSPCSCVDSMNQNQSPFEEMLLVTFVGLYRIRDQVNKFLESTVSFFVPISFMAIQGIWSDYTDSRIMKKSNVGDPDFFYTQNNRRWQSKNYPWRNVRQLFKSDISVSIFD